MLASVEADVGRVRRPGRRTVSLRHAHPSLDSTGVAVEWFENYVNPRPDVHDLDVVLLTFVVEGSGTHHVAGEERPTRGPCLDVSRLGESHSLVTDAGGMRVVNVYLSERFALPRLGDGLDDSLALVIPPVGPLTNRHNRLNRLDVEDPEPLLRLIRDLDSELRGDPAGRSTAVQARSTLLLLHCAREVARTGLLAPTALRGRTALAVEEVRRHLDEHYADEFTLADLASMANLERTSFSRAFSTHVGVPVVRYLNQRRTEAAARLLRGSTLTVAEVAGAVGFRDLSHFTRTFRGFTGATPRGFRDDAGRRL